MLGKAGKGIRAFKWIHALACPSENTLIAAEIITWRVKNP
jgi:hypothetical protein